MKNVKSMFGAMALGLVLFSSAFAGDVSTPGYVAPPPPPSAAPLGDGGTTHRVKRAQQALQCKSY